MAATLVGRIKNDLETRLVKTSFRDCIWWLSLGEIFLYVHSHEKRYVSEAISLLSNVWIYLQQ